MADQPVMEEPDATSVLVATDMPSKADARSLQLARASVPVLRKRRDALAGWATLVALGLVPLGWLLADLTGSSAPLVVGTALVVASVGFAAGQRSVVKHLVFPSAHRFDRGGWTATSMIGVTASAPWGPDLTLAALQGVVVGLARGEVAFVLGGHRLADGQYQAIVALAEAGGSPIWSPT